MVKSALALAAVLLVLAAAAVYALAQQENQIIGSVAAQARSASPALPNGDVIAALQRPGVRVDIVDGFMPPGAPPRPGMPPPRFGMLLHVLGVVPQHVPNGDRTIVVRPDEAFVARFVGTAALVLCAVFAISLVLLRGAAKQAERAALLPLVQTTAALEALAEGDFTPHAIATGERADLSALAQAYTRASRRVALAIAEEAEARAHMRAFIGDAGHELRTPITIVSAYLDVLAQPGADPQAFAKITGGMRAEIKRMRRLVENLLSLTRMEQDAHAVQTVNAAAVAGEVVERFSRIAGSRQISLDAPHGAPVVADARDLDDALSNLVENALKYGNASDVRVAVRSGGDRVWIDVEDAGPGIDERDRARLFDRFFRGANAGGVDGSGLGLAIAKLGVERCGGALRYEPLQPGSRFQIELPAVSA